MGNHLPVVLLLAGAVRHVPLAADREFNPNVTWCIDGVITLSMSCTPDLTAPNAVADIELVRSAITAMSIGLDASVPQPPLQATEEREPVAPSWMPIAGANPNGTSFSSETSIELQMSPSAGHAWDRADLGVAPQVGVGGARDPRRGTGVARRRDELRVHRGR